MTTTIRTTTIDINDASKDAKLWKQLRKLTLGRYSGMSNVMARVEAGDRIDATIVVAWKNDKPVGWSLGVRPSGNRFWWAPSDNSGKQVEFQAYVARPYRKQGIGNKLFAKMRRHYPHHRIGVIPWNKASRAFYARKQVMRV